MILNRKHYCKYHVNNSSSVKELTHHANNKGDVWSSKGKEMYASKTLMSF